MFAIKHSRSNDYLDADSGEWVANVEDATFFPVEELAASYAAYYTGLRAGDYVIEKVL